LANPRVACFDSHVRAKIFFAIGLAISCSSNPPPAAVKPAPSASVSVSTTTSREGLSRPSVVEVINQGLGYFMQNVHVKARKDAANKFIGWEIQQLDGAMWTSVDLKPGDIVTKINGQSIETPDAARTVFRSLAVASELRVEFLRDGQPHELRYEIHDE
jgi:type II secretory pathway component PulC